MVILAIETSAAQCAVAVVSGGAVFARAEAMERGHAERLMPMIAEVMAEAGIGWEAIETVAVCTGPGSFTGIRVGVAAARGIALGRGIPAVGVTRLEALAFGRGAVRVAVEGRGGSGFALKGSGSTGCGDVTGSIVGRAMLVGTTVFTTVSARIGIVGASTVDGAAMLGAPDARAGGGAAGTGVAIRAGAGSAGAGCDAEGAGMLDDRIDAGPGPSR